MTAQFELYCDDPRHKLKRDGGRRIVTIAKFRKASPIPAGGFQKRVPGEKVERLPEVWSVEPGASAERRKKQRAWTPPAEPVTKPDPTEKLSLERLLASVHPGDDNKLGTYRMVGKERLRFTRLNTDPGAPVREKFQRKCSLCPRQVDRYMDDLGKLWDLLLAQGVFRYSLEGLGVMLAEQAKRRR